MNATPELAPSPAPAPAPRGRRRWWLIAAAAVVVVVAVLVTVLLTRPAQPVASAASTRPVPCGTTVAYCFPGVTSAAVIGHLTSAGYACRADGTLFTLCAPAGGGAYLQLGGVNGKINAVWTATSGATSADSSVRQLDALLGQVLPQVLPHDPGSRQTFTDWIAAQAAAPGDCPRSVREPGNIVLGCVGTPVSDGKVIRSFDITVARP